MLNYKAHFHVFSEDHLYEFLTENDQKVRSAIEQEKADLILNADELEYIETLTQSFSLEAPQIDFDKIIVTDDERETSGSMHPGIFPDRVYKVQVLTFHLPYSGNAALLKYRPSQYFLWSTDVFLENQNVCFEITNRERNTEQVKAEKQRIITMMKDLLGTLTKDIEEYNSKLPGLIERTFNARKHRLLENKKMLDDLL